MGKFYGLGASISKRPANKLSGDSILYVCHLNVMNVGCIACLTTIRNRIARLVKDDNDLSRVSITETEVDLIDGSVTETYTAARAEKTSHVRVRLFGRVKDRLVGDKGKDILERAISAALEEIGFENTLRREPIARKAKIT